jgi:hypothetical protein
VISRGRAIPFGSAVQLSTRFGLLRCVTLAIVPAGAYVSVAQPLTCCR